MFFKNIHLYQFDGQFALTGKQLNDALEGRKARPCGQLELAVEGWVQPLGVDGQMYVHEIDRRMMVCLRREEKVVPASLVREMVDQKVSETEKATGYSVGRKERADIKDQLMQELLPRALIKASHTFAYIDAKDGWLVVNASSAKRSSELVSMLQKTIVNLNVTMPQTNLSPESAMTHWLLNEESLPEGFGIEDEVEFRSAGNPVSIIRCKHVDLGSSEILAHISAGKRAYRMAMNWHEKLSFVLCDDMSIKRIRFDFEALDQDDTGGDEVAQFDADFSLMTGEFSEFIPSILSALNVDEGADGS